MNAPTSLAPLFDFIDLDLRALLTKHRRALQTVNKFAGENLTVMMYFRLILNQRTNSGASNV